VPNIFHAREIDAVFPAKRGGKKIETRKGACLKAQIRVFCNNESEGSPIVGSSWWFESCW